MKIKLFIVILAIPLLSTKCAQETVFFTIKNKSDFDMAITSAKDTVLLKEMYERGTYIQSEFNTIEKNKITRIPFTESDLNFYLANDRKSYTFYFFKYTVKDTFNNRIHFEKIYDSISVAKKAVNIGKDKNNTFIYEKGKVKFISE